MLDEGATVHCFFRDSNHTLGDHLQEIARNVQRLQLHPITLPRVHYPRLFNIFRPKTLKHLRQRFRELEPEIVFVSQGNLGISAFGVLAAHRESIFCISYIPMAHTFAAMQHKHAWMRDRFTRYIAKLPNLWLTCTNEQREKLRGLGAQQAIHLLPNCIEVKQAASKETARLTLKINATTPVLGMVGRLNNKQKGCDLFVSALIRSAPDSPLRSTTLLFIGDGEDWPTSRRKLEANGWQGRIHHIKWTAHPEHYYAALDLLVMPSHFEGLPLSMQEALLCDVPIAASAVDGLKSFLPAEWLCPANNSEALGQLMEKFLNAPTHYRSSIATLRTTVQQQHSKKSVHNALLKAFRLGLKASQANSRAQ